MNRDAGHVSVETTITDISLRGLPQAPLFLPSGHADAASWGGAVWVEEQRVRLLEGQSFQNWGKLKRTGGEVMMRDVRLEKVA